MASEWFYARDGQQYGPVSSQLLRELASSGQLLPTDLIWKEGMEQWRPAGESSKLFPNASATTKRPKAKTAPAPSVEVKASVSERVRKTAQTAAQATQLIAERAHLTTVALPAAYQELGTHCYTARTYESVFPNEFSAIARHTASITASVTHVAESAPTSFAAHARSLATKGMTAAKRYKAVTDQAKAFTQLGRAAHAKYGATAGPPELVARVTKALERLAELDRHIAEYKPLLRPNGFPSKIWTRGLAAASVALLCGIIGYGFLPHGRPGHATPRPSPAPGSERMVAPFPNDVAGSLTVAKDVNRLSQTITEASQKRSQPTAPAPLATSHSAPTPKAGSESDPLNRKGSSQATAGNTKAYQSRSPATNSGGSEMNLANWRGTQEKDVPEVYLKGPNGEFIEDLYVVNAGDGGVNLVRGYVVGEQVRPEQAVWQGMRQPILEAAMREKRFISHGQRIIWEKANAPPIPDRHQQAIAYSAQERPALPPPPPGNRHMTDYWLSNARDGVVTQYHPNGAVEVTGRYAGGLKDGPWVAYWPNGRKSLEHFWVKGKRHGTETGWHDNGALAYSGNLVEGKLDGTWQWFFEDGTPRAEETRDKGIRQGTSTYWHANGQVRLRIPYTNGEYDGECISYWENGAVKAKVRYVAGNAKEPELWDEEGKRIEAPSGKKAFKSMYDAGVYRGTQFARILMSQVDAVGIERAKEIYESTGQEEIEKMREDLRLYPHIPDIYDHARGFLKGFDEAYKYEKP